MVQKTSVTGKSSGECDWRLATEKWLVKRDCSLRSE